MGIGLIGCMKLNARLFHLPPEKRPKGKPRPMLLAGKRLLGMEKRLTDGRIKWRQIVFSQWYGKKEKQMLITSGMAIWHKFNTLMVKVR